MTFLGQFIRLVKSPVERSVALRIGWVAGLFNFVPSPDVRLLARDPVCSLPAEPTALLVGRRPHAFGRTHQDPRPSGHLGMDAEGEHGLLLLCRGALALLSLTRAPGPWDVPGWTDELSCLHVHCAVCLSIQRRSLMTDANPCPQSVPATVAAGSPVLKVTFSSPP